MMFQQCTDWSAKLRPRGHQLWADGLFLKSLPSPALLSLKPLIFFTEIIIVYFISPFGPFDRSAKLRPRGDPERDDGHYLRFLPSPTRFFIEGILACFMLPFWLSELERARPSNVQDTFPEDQGDLSQGNRIAVTVSCKCIFACMWKCMVHVCMYFW